jgi:DNA polymerase I-like protein with 3'-5' exonuclease and polymerase domains
MGANTVAAIAGTLAPNSLEGLLGGLPLDGTDTLDKSGNSEDIPPTPDTCKPRRHRSKSVRYSTDSDAALAAIRKHRAVAVDLETDGLHPHAGRSGVGSVGAVILCAGKEKFIFRSFPSWWWEVLADASIKKIGHNLKFDLMWMIDAYPPELGVLTYVRNVQDTMLKSQLVNRYRTVGGVKKSGMSVSEHWTPNDLASVVHRWLGGVVIGKEIDHDVTDWTGEWSVAMIEYMLEDIQYLTRLNDRLDKELRSQGQERAAAIEMDVVFGSAWMTYNGFKPDVNAWHQAIHGKRDGMGRLVLNEQGVPVQQGWIEEHQHLLWHLRKMFPTVNNFNSPGQLVAAMPEAIGAPLVNLKKSTLAQLVDAIPKIACLVDERLLQTRLKNWGEHYLINYVCKVCQRFHPDWRQIGTETSRFSCAKPNLQQIPRAKEFRRLFVAEEGYLLASLDYSAIEVLTAAVFADERGLMAACATGDPHKATAEMVVGHPVKKEDKERQDAKIANFGLLFAGGAPGLVKQAREVFGITISLEDAKRIVATYFNLYPNLRLTKNLAYRAMETPGPVEVRNMVGFRRWLEGYSRKPTSWLNTIIQSSAGYGLKSAFRYLMEAGLLPFLIAQVHDELIFEFPEEDAPDLQQQAKACMIQGMRDVIGKYAPVIVDDTALGKVWL